MKYLRKFATKADMADLEQPNVVLIGENGEILYNAILNGVYIQHIDGKLYTREDWTAKAFANDEANGVAVIADECSFVMSIETLSADTWTDNTNFLIDGVFSTTSQSEALKDYNGKKNTAHIKANETSGAATICSNYIFPNGANGYLPSVGEMYIAYLHKDEINAARTLFKTKGYTWAYWTSTQGDESTAWYNVQLNSFICASKSMTAHQSMSFSVIPFTTL